MQATIDDHRTSAVVLTFRRRSRTPAGWSRKRRGPLARAAVRWSIVGCVFAAAIFVPRFASDLYWADEIIAGQVSKVIDGDSILVGRTTEIRLADFSAPEYDEDGGRAAKLALRRIALGRSVACTYCEGARVPFQCTSYDRIIATCRLGGETLGDLMRRAGISEGGR